jgi:hypothetical protein
MALAIGEVYTVRAYCRFGDQIGLNVRHARITGITAASLTETQFATALNTLLGPAYSVLMTNQAEYYGTEVQRRLPTPLPPVTSASPAVAGTAGTNPLPLQTCGLVRVGTATPGRAGRGRIYLPFPDAASTTNVGQPKPTAAYLIVLTAIAGVWTAPITLTAGPDAVAIDWGLLSPAGLYRPITNYRVRPYWATQRRRSNYGRTNVPPF